MNINDISKHHMWRDDFFDFVKVLEFGEKKHPRLNNDKPNWLEPNGNKSSFKEMHESMWHHLSESWCQGRPKLSTEGGRRCDRESDLDPLLHLICRAQMMYVRLKHCITHSDDIDKSNLVEKIKLTVTLKQLKAIKDCTNVYRKLLRYLKSMNLHVYPSTEVNLLTILESNGIYDFFWIIQHIDLHSEKTYRLIACDFAELSLINYTNYNANNTSVSECIKTAREYALGVITKEQLSAIYATAKSTAMSAMYASETAARSAAMYASETAMFAMYATAKSTAMSAMYAAMSATQAAKSTTMYDAKSVVCAYRNTKYSAIYAAETANKHTEADYIKIIKKYLL